MPRSIFKTTIEVFEDGTVLAEYTQRPDTSDRNERRIEHAPWWILFPGLTTNRIVAINIMVGDDIQGMEKQILAQNVAVALTE